MLYLRFHCKLQGFLHVRKLSNHSSILAVFAENPVFYNENATTAGIPQTSTFEVFWRMSPGTPFESLFYSFLDVFPTFFFQIQWASKLKKHNNNYFKKVKVRGPTHRRTLSQSVNQWVNQWVSHSLSQSVSPCTTLQDDAPPGRSQYAPGRSQ